MADFGKGKFWRIFVIPVSRWMSGLAPVSAVRVRHYLRPRAEYSCQTCYEKNPVVPLETAKIVLNFLL